MGYEDFQENVEHDRLWGKYLFELHTKSGTVAITPELAGTLSYRDLECLVAYPSTVGNDVLLLPVVHMSISACVQELEKREQNLEEA